MHHYFFIERAVGHMPGKSSKYLVYWTMDMSISYFHTNWSEGIWWVNIFQDQNRFGSTPLRSHQEKIRTESVWKFYQDKKNWVGHLPSSDWQGFQGSQVRIYYYSSFTIFFKIMLENCHNSSPSPKSEYKSLSPKSEYKVQISSTKSKL